MATRKVKTVKVPGATCDVCAMEFTASAPLPASYDGIIGSMGHGYACETHKGALTHVTCRIDSGE